MEVTFTLASAHLEGALRLINQRALQLTESELEPQDVSEEAVRRVGEMKIINTLALLGFILMALFLFYGGFSEAMIGGL